MLILCVGRPYIIYYELTEWAVYINWSNDVRFCRSPIDHVQRAKRKYSKINLHTHTHQMPNANQNLSLRLHVMYYVIKPKLYAHIQGLKR